MVKFSQPFEFQVLIDSLSMALIFHLALFYQKKKQLLFFGCTGIQQFNLD